MTLNSINNIEINTVMDLYKIKKIMEAEAIEKVNYSELGRELNKDPRTIKKYIHTDTEKLKIKKRIF
ncbi:hypothetical protein, partial [Streptobacillus canis]|uniref:hypothetical protein n=1 Tax=Streptobacillus canis TaxID=2678686 RepID=UPI0038B5E451